MYEIIEGYPPNIADIIQKFGNVVWQRDTVFTYGNTIYNPRGHKLPPDLIEHEKMHILQQSGDPQSWWKKYLEDNQFRLEQEVEAYGRQYAFTMKHYGRNDRRLVLKHIIKTLSGPLYGHIIDPDSAKNLIEKEALRWI